MWTPFSSGASLRVPVRSVVHRVTSVPPYRTTTAANTGQCQLFSYGFVVTSNRSRLARWVGQDGALMMDFGHYEAGCALPRASVTFELAPAFGSNQIRQLRATQKRRKGALSAVSRRLTCYSLLHHFISWITASWSKRSLLLPK